MLERTCNHESCVIRLSHEIARFWTSVACNETKSERLAAASSPLIQNVRFADSGGISLPSVALSVVFLMVQPIHQRYNRKCDEALFVLPMEFQFTQSKCKAMEWTGSIFIPIEMKTAPSIYNWRERRNNSSTCVWRHLENSKIVKNGWNAMSYLTRAHECAHHLHATLQCTHTYAPPPSLCVCACVICVVSSYIVGHMQICFYSFSAVRFSDRWEKKMPSIY